MTPAQSRAARGLLGWSQEHLATMAGVSVRTLISFEKGERTPMERNISALRAALEAAGVRFLEENGGGAGVRLAKPTGPAIGSG